MRHSLLLLILLPLFACEAEVRCEFRSLNILLTNDDGYDQPGIIALHRALDAAGHYVIRVAPVRNYSGASASLTFDTFTGTNRPDEEFSEIYAIDGSPATTVLLGGTAIFGSDVSMDLVMSGINNGANLGPALPISGTVGAITAASRLFDPPVRGVGVSTDRWDGNSPEDNFRHLARVADFITRLVAAAQCSDDSLFNAGQSLNVNYPRIDPSAIKGVRVARQGNAHYLSMAFEEAADDKYKFGVQRVVPTEDIADSDVLLHRLGYITIVPMDADISAAPAFDADELLKTEP